MEPERKENLFSKGHRALEQKNVSKDKNKENLSAIILMIYYISKKDAF